MYPEIANPLGYRAGLYVRISKEDENEGPSESISNQLSLLSEFALKKGIEIFDKYIDDGWSGTSFDRPEFKRLIDDIETKKVNMVITKDLSRLGRDYIMTGHYMERYFPEKRVRYISLLDGIDTGIDSTANDITPFRAIMNDMYAKDISKKIRSVKHDKQRRGLFIGGKALYGYKIHPLEKNHIVIDEEAAAIVRRIFDLTLDGLSCRGIADLLNKEKIPSPAGYAGLSQGRSGPYSGLWSSERISEMLQNETYIGNMVQGRSAKISYKSKKIEKRAREDWVVVEGTHEPIIDLETFKRAGEMVKSRRRTRCRSYDFLLKGLIFCHECGYPLAVMNRKNKKGEDFLYFVCRTYQRFTRAGVCTCHSIREKTVNDAVIKKIREVCGEYIKDEELESEAEQAVMRTKKTMTHVEAAALKTKIEGLSAYLDRVYMDKLSGNLENTDFERIYKKVKSERSSAEQRLLQLETYESYVPEAEELVRRFTEEMYLSRELLFSLIKRIELTSEKNVIIHFRFAQPDESDAYNKRVPMYRE